MIYIKADALQDGLYQIQDGQIHKYKAKGGTVRTYEMGEIVRCKDCKHYLNEHICLYFSRHGTIETSSYAYCAYGERREDGEA